METPGLSIKLYDLFRKELNLPENKAQEAVQIISETIRESHTGKHEQTLELVHKDTQSLKEYIDIKFATKDDLSSNTGQLRKDLGETKADLIKWMFIFWIGQVAATLGFILLFLK
jgi:hypothetical protein